MPTFPLCHWSSHLFDLRAPSSTDVGVLLLNQPIYVILKINFLTALCFLLPMLSTCQATVNFFHGDKGVERDWRLTPNVSN